jgi:hypothetical protein
VVKIIIAKVNRASQRVRQQMGVDCQIINRKVKFQKYHLEPIIVLKIICILDFASQYGTLINGLMDFLGKSISLSRSASYIDLSKLFKSYIEKNNNKTIWKRLVLLSVTNVLT